MRNGQKRMRGRNNGGHRKSQNPLTRVYESNGPDVKIRGTASHIAEKYIQLARDAQGSGDPVAAENYYQHAEHYFRLIAAAQEQFRQQNPYYQQQGQGGQPASDETFDGEEDAQPFIGQNEPSFAPQPQMQAQPQGQPYLPRDAQPFPQRDHGRMQHNQPQPSGGADMGGLPAFITGGGQPANGSPSGEEQGEQRGDRFGHRRRRRHRGGGNFRHERAEGGGRAHGMEGGDEPQQSE
jgi:type II secretory pathway pseudopilin PulG